MKKLTIVFLVMVMTTLSAFSNNDNNDNNDKKAKKENVELRTKVVTLLGKYQNTLNEPVEASIKFIVNSKGEIVVLSVETEQESIVNFVKSKLNYQKVSLKNLYKMKTFILPVKFVSK
ncbi:hypothetical protein JL193_11840 [Polaribacter batillariae]|uniref:TonB C-terminal domain-containing protein n=1 Tax=Polaribacter batillariae TaxID=2808900 RepID=A0ABX7SRQ2_9FLAO|nr:hypothetical protein [Polaribacter batillariae]QTD36821.1 hypothetical protein JL193_11840 [Polaribacter batillariae]